MAAAADELSGLKCGLSHFSAVDLSGRPRLEDGENLAGDYPAVALVLGERDDAGQGHLYISSTRVIWLKDGQPDQGYFATFPTITMHAISQEPQPCIYAQLEPCGSNSQDEESGEEEELYPEIRFIPSDANTLQDIFENLCQCAALNPDPVDEDDSDGGEFFYNEDEVLNGVGAENRAALLDHFDAMLDDSDQHELEELTGEDPDRFADPEDDDEEGVPDAVHPSH
ncbi:MAG: chloride conductance regulatory ICln [Trebouxia sp. A1-2]|nr:MAG: chloride conductance regulatory ICln [Trebouxia sp. A1-2]